MTVEPVRDVRNHFSEVIGRVEDEHERVTVTRNGSAIAASGDVATRLRRQGGN